MKLQYSCSFAVAKNDFPVTPIPPLSFYKRNTLESMRYFNILMTLIETQTFPRNPKQEKTMSSYISGLFTSNFSLGERTNLEEYEMHTSESAFLLFGRPCPLLRCHISLQHRTPFCMYSMHMFYQK